MEYRNWPECAAIGRGEYLLYVTVHLMFNVEFKKNNKNLVIKHSLNCLRDLPYILRCLRGFPWV